MNILQNSGYLDQMQHYVASDLGLHCLPILLLIEVFSIKRIKGFNT